jgi:hypothetical protein
VELQLLQDVAHVVLHRVLGDVELTGDVTVAETARDELEHLELAFGQSGRQRTLAVVRLLREHVELREELRSHRR